jgi:putative peptide zinc metalloprotease protein
VKGSAYQLLSAFANEPHLHGKAYRTLLNQLRGKNFKQSDSLVLAGFAALTALYGFVLIGAVMMMVGVYLQQVMLGGTAIVIAVLLGGYLARRAYTRLQLIEVAYERSIQFERWRKRTLPQATGEAEDELKPAKGLAHYLKIAAGLTLLIILALPYPYEPGGQFMVHPSEQQQITTDVEGVIEEVLVDGGETLKKGSLLARLNTDELKTQVKVQEGLVAEQASVVADLKSRPKPEEVKLAEQALEVAKENERFSKARVPRFEEMAKEGTASQDELDLVRKQYQVDASQVLEKKAALDLAKTGATKEQVEAAQAKLAALKDQLSLAQDKVKRAVLTMPIDGTLLTLHLKEKTNSYLERGKPFAVAENTGAVTVEIEVPETDIAEVAVGAKVEVRPMAFSTQLFEGKVTLIDRNVTTQSFGTVVKVLAQVNNADQLLRTGMTGQAKVQGASMPVWQAFSRGVQRFLTVQVWSWIP